MNSSSGTSDVCRISRGDLQHFAQRGAGLQRALAGALDHRTIGDGVGERHAQFDQVRAAAHQRFHQRRRALGRWIARREIGDQALAPVRASSSRNRLPDAASLAASSSLKIFAVDVDVLVAASRTHSP